MCFAYLDITADVTNALPPLDAARGRCSGLERQIFGWQDTRRTGWPARTIDESHVRRELNQVPKLRESNKEGG